MTFYLTLATAILAAQNMYGNEIFDCRKVKRSSELKRNCMTGSYYLYSKVEIPTRKTFYEINWKCLKKINQNSSADNKRYEKCMNIDLKVSSYDSVHKTISKAAQKYKKLERFCINRDKREVALCFDFISRIFESITNGGFDVKTISKKIKAYIPKKCHRNIRTNLGQCLYNNRSNKIFGEK